MRSVEIIALRVDIPEPSYTYDMKDSEIYDTLVKKYRKGGKGKRYNIVTEYADKIIESIKKEAGNTNLFFLPTVEDKDPTITIKYPVVRQEWIKAVMKYMFDCRVKSPEANTLVFYK